MSDSDTVVMSSPHVACQEDMPHCHRPAPKSSPESPPETLESLASLQSLQSLLRIGNALARETDLNRLLATICHETEQALGADRATVFVYDAAKDMLWSQEGTGLSGLTLYIPAGEGIAGYILHQGAHFLNIADAYADDRFNPAYDHQTGYQTGSMLAIRLNNRQQQPIGVFQAINKNGKGLEPFTPHDELVFQAIAASASIALENALLMQARRRTFESFIETLAVTIDARDPITSGHSWRVAGYTRLLGEQLGISGTDLEPLHFAALLHDIGKIGIREDVLTKNGLLTVNEYRHIQDHVAHTYAILQRIEFEPHLADIPRIAASHHERLDGSGYGEGLVGSEIPEGGLILAIADVFDALTSLRHYRDRMSFLDVLNYFRQKAGRQFEPRFVDAFLHLPVAPLLSIMQEETQKIPETSGTSPILLPDDLTVLTLERELLDLGVDAHQHPFSRAYRRERVAFNAS